MRAPPASSCGCAAACSAGTAGTPPSLSPPCSTGCRRCLRDRQTPVNSLRFNPFAGDPSSHALRQGTIPNCAGQATLGGMRRAWWPLAGSEGAKKAQGMMVIRLEQGQGEKEGMVVISLESGLVIRLEQGQGVGLRTEYGFHEGGEGAEARLYAVEEAAEDEADGDGGDHAVLLLQHHAHHIAQPRRVPHHPQRYCTATTQRSPVSLPVFLPSGWTPSIYTFTL